MTLTVPQRASEIELVSQAASGDVESFSELVRRHQDDWYTLALRLLGDPEVAADVTQEVTIRCWKSIGAFRGDSKFSTWTYRIVVNTSWTQRRRARRHQTTSIDAVDDPTHDPLEFHADRLGIREEVSKALWSLSAANRTVVVLKDVYGWSHSEVAETLGITVTAAKVRLHRGRTSLRHQLAGVV
ncbi:MAG TPA: RNA polymerase sigma factor [Acidimicrobiia bacterium]|jgi:RNA polymerase sigma-70 factor (ECF subfamily)